MTTNWFVLTRAVHLGACLLFFGIFVFDRFAAITVSSKDGTGISDYWSSRLRFFSLLLPPVILLSGFAWFALAAMTMSGQPLQWEILKTVWTQTEFGTVWKIRLVFWLASAVVTAIIFILQWPPVFRKHWIWLQINLGAFLLGSLAWAGHGLEGSLWHLLADILHLLVAGLWPTGLLPFALLLRRLRQPATVTDWISIGTLVRRFSAISLGSVTLLVATGLVNSWFLVGSLTNLFKQAYGRWLLTKIILFGVAVAIGAMNLLRLKPRFPANCAPPSEAEATAAQLQLNVWLELILGSVIVMVVAILGMLPPANQ